MTDTSMRAKLTFPRTGEQPVIARLALDPG